MTEKLPYAILRIGKIKDFKTLAAVEYHNTRQIPSGTVDGAPPPQDLVQLEGSYRERIEQVFEETGANWEKGKVLAVEMLVTASPEWWATATPEERKEWWKAQWRFARDKFGQGLIAFTTHLDESTPHCHFVGIPLYLAIEKKRGAKPKTPEALRAREAEEAAAPKIWRLSYDKLFGGDRERLAGLQTEYHGYVKHLGLARGRDTVGLEIKHQTLKEYRALLRKAEQDLAQQAAELLEERQVLDHYEQRLSSGYAELREDELALFAKQEEGRVREEALADRERLMASREQDLHNREKALDQREVDAVKRIMELAQREGAIRDHLARIDAETTARKQAQALLDVRNDRVAERERAAELRDDQLAAKEEGLTQRETALEKIQHQLSLVGGLFTGRLSGQWDAEHSRPKNLQGKISGEERDAVTTPWPTWVATAARHAFGIAEIRRAAAQKVAKLLRKLRVKQQTARDEVKKAEAEVAAAESRARAENEAARVRREADQRAERAIAASIENAAARLSSLTADTVSMERRGALAQSGLLALQDEEDQSRQKVAHLHDEISNIVKVKDDSLANLREVERQRDEVRASIVAMERDRAAFALERTALAKDREEFNWEKTRHGLSGRLIEELFAGSTTIDIVAGGLRVHRHAGTVESLVPGTFEPWVPGLVEKHRQVEWALGQLEALETELRSSRKSLESRYPDKAQDLRAEQAKETDRVNQMLGRVPMTDAGIGS